jgi:hypothetical protein
MKCVLHDYSHFDPILLSDERILSAFVMTIVDRVLRVALSTLRLRRFSEPR